jgi:predicted ATPase
MITNLSLTNFKAFDEEFFEFGALNILSGLNNSGKSSVIQSLRLLKEAKPLADLGPLLEYIRNDSKGFTLQCTQSGEAENKVVAFSFERSGEKKYSGDLNGLISYISADRLGPRNLLPLRIGDKVTTVGDRGENIVDFLLMAIDNSELRIPAALVAKEGFGVKENIKEWLRFISPGVEFDYDSYSYADIGRTEFNKHRPVHVGFGLSYTLPIIASILIHSAQLASKTVNSVLLLVENPEAHLHPSGQTKIGEMLALAASCGVQVVVETHSDHLLNGIRIAVKKKKILHTDVKCFFFEAGKNEEPVTVHHVEIDEYGMVDYWPDGFFDETEKSLQRLL